MHNPQKGDAELKLSFQTCDQTQSRRNFSITVLATKKQRFSNE